jgi:hypothetical protein
MPVERKRKTRQGERQNREREEDAGGEEKKKGHLDKGEQRRRVDGIFQGLMHNFRKLQGSFCKAKISH